MEPSDLLLINRGDQTFKVESSNLMAIIEDSDWLLINRSDTTLKISGADVRQSLNTGSPLSPALPPFGGLTSTETVFDSADGKVEFSLDGVNYLTNLTVPINTFYYVDWGTDILSVAHGDPYEAQITASYTNLGTSNTVDFKINAIDKLPDAFSFTPIDDVPSQTQFESNTVSPVESINAPSQIWVTSDAAAFELRVGNGVWFNPPGVPGSAYVSQNQEIQVRHTTGDQGSTAYTTTVHIGYGTNPGEYESADFVTNTQAISIATPVIGGDVGTDTPSQPTFTCSAYSVVGAAGSHQSTDWQIARDSGFNDIVFQRMGTTTALTALTPYVVKSPSADQETGRLDGNTTYYVRAKYHSDLGFTSDWSDVETLTTETLSEDFSNGADTITRNNNEQLYTVPANVGAIRVTLHGGQSGQIRGGRLKGTFKVVPGEKFLITTFGSSVALWEDVSLTNREAQRNSLIAGCGAHGGNGSYNNELENGTGMPGGNGGGPTGGTGSGASNSGGRGGTQNAPGAGGDPAGGNPPATGSDGNGMSGGSGAVSTNGAYQARGGQGGYGWYGGGGGAAWSPGTRPWNEKGAGGGGGSSKFQTVQNPWRAGNELENVQGGADGNGARVIIEY